LPANDTGVISLSINDAFGNAVPAAVAAAVTVKGTLTWLPEQDPPYWSGKVPPPLSMKVSPGAAGTNLWTLTYMTIVSGYYTAVVTLDGVALAATYSVTIAATSVWRGDVMPPAISNSCAGCERYFYIQAFDIFNNTRPAVNDVGLDFKLTIVPGVQWNGEVYPNYTVTCAAGTAGYLPSGAKALPWTVGGSAAFCRPNPTVAGQYHVRMVSEKQGETKQSSEQQEQRTYSSSCLLRCHVSCA
jgi:hypothetical protein